MSSKEKLQADLAELVSRKETAYQSYHQILGAISMVEQMIFRIDNPDFDKKQEPEE